MFKNCELLILGSIKKDFRIHLWLWENEYEYRDILECFKQFPLADEAGIQQTPRPRYWLQLLQ